MVTIPVDTVRQILGDWGGGFTDDAIASSSIAVMVEAEISSACPTWNTITDPEALERIQVAVAYLAAARLLTNVGGTKSMTLGDQMITYNTNFIAGEQSRWRKDALSLIGDVCPIAPKPKLVTALYFGKASGRRG